MHVCGGCGFEAKSGTGFAAHRRACTSGAAPVEVSVVDGVRRQMPKGAPAAVSAAALKVARLIDLSESPRDVASLSRELRELMAAAGEGAPEVEVGDVVDEVAAARARRLREADADVSGTS